MTATGPPDPDATSHEVNPPHDVVVVGDGPAGSALAQALKQRNVDVALIGPDEPWAATYGTWADDVESSAVLGGADIWLQRLDSIAVRFTEPRTIHRPYGVVDNDRLRTVLRAGVVHCRATPSRVDLPAARLVIDSTGWPSALDDGARVGSSHTRMAWQTAYGVVLPEPPVGLLGKPMMMDFSEPNDGRSGSPLGAPTFAYALPVRDGWLVEETVLAAAPAIDPDRLAPRLAERLDVRPRELDELGVRVERVRIPMGAPARRPPRGSNVVPFGAAAGMIHPATGYSIAASLAAAAPVADRIVDALASPRRHERGRFDEIVWTDDALRTRALHEFGLDVLRKMDGDGVRSFFEAFFDSAPELWSAFLRIDSSPRVVARLMRSMFGRADWSLRRQLLRSNPVPLARALV